MTLKANIACEGAAVQRMVRVTLVVLFCVVTLPATTPVGSLYGQSRSDEKPLTFDVVVVKENKSGSPDSRIGGPPSRFSATNLTTFQLIAFAYDREDFGIESVPNWAKVNRFDITAKADGVFPIGQPGSFVAQRAMLRSFLIDRFKLVTHTESKQLPIYALVAARADKVLGPQLHRSNSDCAAIISARLRGQGPAALPGTPDALPDCAAGWPPGRITGGTQPMTMLATMLSRHLQRPVEDRTGLTGTYSFTLTWTPDNLPQRASGTRADQPLTINGITIDPNGPSIFTALQEQLGLKLESTRGPVDVLVIDHVERPIPD